MTLLEIIATHEAAHAERAVLTPKGLATVAARRLALALADLPFEQRTSILVHMLWSVPCDLDGGVYSLMTSHPPTLDPQTA
jgi:hypothetical protein